VFSGLPTAQSYLELSQAAQGPHLTGSRNGQNWRIL